MSYGRVGNGAQWRWWRLWITALGLAGALFFMHPLVRAEENGQGEQHFAIKLFDISGNTIFSDEALAPLVKPFTGPSRTARDVEKAREKIEKYYHQQGYPTVLVNIPEQDAATGEIRLEVIESTIRRVRVTGNRYYTMEKILTMTPSLQPGSVIYLPKLQADLIRLNRHPDLKVAPTLTPGKELGTIDVELKVVDKLPLHGSLELNNRNTHTTTDLRLNAQIKYDNLWQRDHSATLQFQTSPQDTAEVQAYAGSYVMTPFWNDDHVLALYGIYSNSDTAFADEFRTTGKGFVVGVRNVIPLGGSTRYYHNATLGVDYKDFDELLWFGSSADDLRTPVTYVPLSLGYGAVQRDGTGTTEASLGLNLLLRGVVTDRQDFEDKRYHSRANYVYALLRLTRTQQLWAGLEGVVKLEGQLSDQPLVSNEQYYAGGMNSVNGYKESEAGGDNAVRARIELRSPDLWDAWSQWKTLDLRIHLFYDYAQLWRLDPLAGEAGGAELQGTGAGLGGAVGSHLDWAVQWGMALACTDGTEQYDQQVYFYVKGKF